MNTLGLFVSRKVNDRIYIDGSNAGYYAIFYNNISEEEIQKYIDQLKTLGYAEEASASESVSTGVLLRKDETWISIAYSEEDLESGFQ